MKANVLRLRLLPVVAAGQPVSPSDLAFQPSITTIATNIATADSGIYVAACPAVDTDGTNYLVVSKRSDFVSEHRVGSVVSSSGAAQVEFPITEPFINHGGAAAAFAGNTTCWSFIEARTSSAFAFPRSVSCSICPPVS